MYLSHNIINEIIKLENALTKMQVGGVNKKEKQAKLDQTRINNSFYFANNIGINISLKETDKIINSKAGEKKQIETNDFRGDLFENFDRANDLVNSLIENQNVNIDSALFIQINDSLGKGIAEEWKLRFREPDEKVSLVYDDLTVIIDESYENVEAKPIVDQLLNQFKDLENVNRFYNISLLLYELLLLHPFLTFNKYSLALISDLLIGKEIGKDKMFFSFMQFLVKQKKDILKVFEIEEEASREVAWHEVLLRNVAEQFLDAIDEFTESKQSASSSSGKTKKPFLDLNKRQLKILKYLQSIPTVKREDYVEMMNVSAMTAYRDLSELLDKNLLKTIGRGRGTKYMLASR